MCDSLFKWLPPLALLLALSAPQASFADWTETSVTTAYGTPICASIDDLNGDGVRDYLIGDIDFPLNGQVAAYSGATNLEIYNLVLGGSAGHSVAAAGDLNGDGVEDFMTGALFEDDSVNFAFGSVYLISGADGTTIRKYVGAETFSRFGHDVANAGDLDGDGVPDQMVGSNFLDGPAGIFNGAVYFYSGATGALLNFYQPTAIFTTEVGRSVAGNVDVTGDGIPDLLVGSNVSNASSVGRVVLLSGATFSEILTINGTGSLDLFGTDVTFVPDVDGDGFDDIAVGARGFNSNAGRVSVHSSATGALLWEDASAPAGSFLGEYLTLVPDITGDGRDNLAAGAPSYILPSNGKVFLYDLADGFLMSTVEGGSTTFGHGIAGLTDLNGDGLGEILVGSDDQVEILNFHPHLSADAASVSSAAGGTVAFQHDYASADAGLAYTLLVSRSGRGPTALGSVAIPLTPDPLYSQTLSGSFPSFVTSGNGVLDAAGNAITTIAFPPGVLGGLVGTTLYFASVDGNFGGPANTGSIPVSLVVEP